MGFFGVLIGFKVDLTQKAVRVFRAGLSQANPELNVYTLIEKQQLSYKSRVS